MKILSLLFRSVWGVTCFASNIEPLGNIDRQVEKLLSQMTFLEKLAQTRNIGGILGTNASYNADDVFGFNDGLSGGSISYGNYNNPYKLAASVMSDVITTLRENDTHGIPVINVADSVNGVTLLNTTLFPATLSMAQSWNLDLYSTVIDAISVENRALGIHWVLSPELDLAREPRYGRVGEMYGEDGYLAGEYGVAYVNAMQATDKNGYSRVAATVKHWVYGTSLGGVNKAPIIGGLNDFWNVHLTPYLAVFKKTKPLALMIGYSSFDGVPMHGNEKLTGDVLRNVIDFDGVIISDYAGISDMLTAHKVARDIQDAGQRALLKATINHEIGSPALSGMGNLADLGDNADVYNAVTESCRKMLKLKFLTKTFDEPVPDLDTLDDYIRTKKHQKLNLDVSRESIVLLKNDGILPLSDDLLDSVAVSGPFAHIINPGSYAASDYSTGETYLDGIDSIAGATTFDMGCLWTSSDDFDSMKEIAVQHASEATLAIVVLGSLSVTADTSNDDTQRTDGEFFDHADLGFPGEQVNLLKAIIETGTPVVLVVSGGQAFEMEFAANANGVRAIIHTFLQGEVSGTALAEILTGETNPSGKLTISIPTSSSIDPIFYNYLPSSRKQADRGSSTDYQWPAVDRLPRYPFGYGLSYTTFNTAGVSGSKVSHLGGSISISAKVSNTGSTAGKEIVQVYFQQGVSYIERPVKSLIRFAKVALKGGETKKVLFDIPIEEFGYYVDGGFRVDPDTYTFWVGSSSDDRDLTSFNVTVKAS